MTQTDLFNWKNKLFSKEHKLLEGSSPHLVQSRLFQELPKITSEKQLDTPKKKVARNPPQR